ncbi:hypothetical protein DES49_0334 [Halospina denitrificans]|uniref:Uncharacterized protein n=1 Tax=Halospina denitrificans TaxID=332522 RepID=A0A4R7K1K3_9GAMM|nr:hypothetical protein [Halospina denitrificans]TDT44234.1 hypothetical protein DES49_0334 [Halospina denitrificans]
MRRYRSWSVLAVSLGLFLLVAACGGGGGSGSGESGDTVSASGASQKGPFRSGGTSTAIRLNADGSLSNEQVTGSISERGAYQLSGIDWTGPTLIRMEGDFYDEVAGNFSSDSRTLTAVTDIESGNSPDVNVNLYTYFAAERARSLMDNGEAFADALSTAHSELQSVLGISSAPSELNLLEAIDGVADDSANLLLFSAAVQEGNIGQDGLDALAADFADDGQINGDGADELSTIQEKGTDQLLSDARMQLQNQYSTEPPSSSGGFGWKLSACDAAKLTEPRVFCSDEEFSGTKGDDEGEPILFFPEESGFYAFAMNGTELDSFAGWTRYKDTLSGTELDTGPADGDTTTSSLNAGDQYAFLLNLSGLEQAGDSFALTEARVSDGRASDPVELEVGTAFAARVGYASSGSFPDYGAATSWYRLDGVSGTHTIRTSGYMADSGSGGLRIDVYEGDEGQETVNNIGALPQIDFVNGSGSSSNELTVDLAAGKPHFILITNQFSDYRREINSPPTTGTVEFDLKVNEN